jgi:hypothetical protein
MTRANRVAIRPLSLRAVSGICLLALVTLASLPSPTRAQGSAVLSREQLQALITESSTALRNLIAARDQPPVPALAFKKDKRGKSPEDDLKQSVLSADLQKKLEELEAGATSDLQAGDLPGVQIRLVELRQALKAGIERYQAITEYWREPASQPYTEGAARKDTLKANGIETPNQAQIETLSAQVDREIAANLFVTAMRTTWPKLSELQKQAKSAEYEQLIAKVDSGSLQGFRSATPSRNCVPAERGQTSRTDAPSVRADFPSINDYFPVSMKRKGIQSGTPEVFVLVSAEGCPESAVLVGPSEHEEFDDAGLRLAVDGRYLPAEKDGKPVRAGFYLRLNFYNLM